MHIFPFNEIQNFSFRRLKLNSVYSEASFESKIKARKTIKSQSVNTGPN